MHSLISRFIEQIAEINIKPDTYNRNIECISKMNRLK